jgi:RNA polymerase sigma-70 factor (ECF subfamily)
VRFPHHDLEEVAQQLPVQLPEFTNRADCAEVLPALGKVDEVFRAAVALYYLEDCSYKEIAAILDVPVGTVKSRIARGLAQLREILDSDNGVEPVSGKASAQNAPPPAADEAKDDYDEWDFSSTRVMELFGAV